MNYSSKHQPKTMTQKLILSISLVALVINSLILLPSPAHALIDPLNVTEIYNTIKKDVSSIRNRESCVKIAKEEAYSKVGQRRNVMVFNLSQNYSQHLKDATFGTVKCAGNKYGIWTFSSGEFINQGDGGYVNWAFAGNYKRTGNKVSFYPIKNK